MTQQPVLFPASLPEFEHCLHTEQVRLRRAGFIYMDVNYNPHTVNLLEAASADLLMLVVWACTRNKPKLSYQLRGLGGWEATPTSPDTSSCVSCLAVQVLRLRRDVPERILQQVISRDSTSLNAVRALMHELRGGDVVGTTLKDDRLGLHEHDVALLAKYPAELRDLVNRLRARDCSLQPSGLNGTREITL